MLYVPVFVSFVTCKIVLSVYSFVNNFFFSAYRIQRSFFLYIFTNASQSLCEEGTRRSRSFHEASEQESLTLVTEHSHQD